jgi:3-hydroxyacyl-[acyl-carrier-protein] dehydratase
MSEPWNIKKIESVLPQRYPFLFVDRVISIDTDAKKAVCEKRFTFNESFFKGHFPGNPIVPGVIMIEALAQTSIILFSQLRPEIADRKPDYLLGKVEAKFKRKVVPGDTLTMEVTPVKLFNNAGIVEAVGKVGDEVAVEGTISFGIVLKNS